MKHVDSQTPWARKYSLKTLLIVCTIAGIGAWWASRGDYRAIGPFVSKHGISITLYDERGFCDVRRFVMYQVTASDGISTPIERLAAIECACGNKRSDYQLVEAENVVGLFLTLDSTEVPDRSVARLLLLLAYDVSDGDRFVNDEVPIDMQELLVTTFISSLERE